MSTPNSTDPTDPDPAAATDPAAAAAAASAAKEAKSFIVFFDEDWPVKFPSLEVAYRAVAILLYVRRIEGDKRQAPYGMAWSSEDVRAVRKLFANCLISREWAASLEAMINEYVSKLPENEDTQEAAVLARRSKSYLAAFEAQQQLVSLLDDYGTGNGLPSLRDYIEEKWQKSYTSREQRDLALVQLDYQLSWFTTPHLDVEPLLKRFDRCFRNIKAERGDFLAAVDSYEEPLRRAIKISKAMKF